MKIGMLSIGCCLMVAQGAWAATNAAGQEASPPQGEQQPGLLFYLPFDGSLIPSVAAGKAQATLDKPDVPPAFVDGVKGKAVLFTNNLVSYPALDNLLTSQGAICFWAKPVTWDPRQPETMWRGFFDAHQRAGAGGEDKIAFWRYPEGMSKAYNSFGAYNYHSAQGSNLGSMIFDIKDWQQNQWRFFALSWNKAGTFRFYMDGKLTGSEERKKDVLPVNINQLSIAAPGTAMDEFKVFGYALSDDAVRQEYQRSAAAAGPVADIRTNATPRWEKPAFPSGPATVTATPFSVPVVLDGMLADPSWKQCIEVRDMVITGGGNAYPTDQTAFRAGYTPEALYLFVECPSRAAKPKMTVRDHDGPVFSDDSVELFIEPEAGSGKYYQFVANALGARFESCGMDAKWNGEWDVAAGYGEGGWRLEFAVPFATLGIKPEAGKAIGFNLCRNDFAAGGEWQTWARLPGTYHDPAYFGRLVLGSQSVGLSAPVLKRTPSGDATVDVQVTNAGKEPLEITVMAELKTAAGGFAPAEKISVAPGTTAPAILKASGACKQPGPVSIATAVFSGQTILAFSPGKTVPFAAIPVASGAGDVVTLENDKVRFDFDKVSGFLVSIVNKATGAQLMPRRKPTPVFELEAVPFKTKSVTFTDDDIQKFAPDNTTCLECVVDKDVLRQKHLLACGAEVEITVSLPPGGEISRWDIAVSNLVTSTPSRSFIIHRVLFPRLMGLRVDDTDSKQALAVPQICGLLVPSPAANLSKTPSYTLLTQRGADKDVQNGRYIPSWPSMSWMDLSGTRGGLYIVSQDRDPLYDFALETANDQANGEMELSIKRYCPTFPGETWKPGPCAVGVHPGDWHWSADRYREWFYTNFKPRPLPKWLRDVSGWTDSGGGKCNYAWNDLPESIRRGKPYGMDYIQKWCNMTAGELGDYPAFPFPNPYAGSYSEFNRAVDEIHKLGGRLGFYHNLTSDDPVVGRLVGQPRYRQKIPAEFPIPSPDPYANGLLNSCKLTQEGAWWTGGGVNGYLDGYYWACWGPNPWMEYCYDWLTRWRKTFKLDVCYLDSTGPAAAVCFNTNHGHKKPSGQMQFVLDFYKRLAKGTDPDYAICQEFVWDRLMIDGTHSLTCMHIGPFSEPALFRYVHSDYPLFCGCVNFFGGKKDVLDGALPDPTWPEFLAYVYLYGARFDHFGILWNPENPDEWLSDPAREERDLLLLRKSVAEDLNWKCDFRDRIGLSALPEKVYSRVFVRKDKSGALLTLLDLRTNRAPFAVTLDLKANGLSKATAAELVEGGGKSRPLPAPSVADDLTTINVPALAGKTAAIRIFTTR